MRRVVIAGVLIAGVAGALLSLGLSHGAPARAAATATHAARATTARRTRVVPSTPRISKALAQPGACYVATTCSQHPCTELIGSAASTGVVSAASGAVYSPTTPRPTATCRGASSPASGVDRVVTHPPAIVVSQPASVSPRLTADPAK
jgi:hypothetical protein